MMEKANGRNIEQGERIIDGEEGDVSKMQEDGVQKRSSGKRKNGEDGGGNVVLNVLEDGIEDVLGVNDVHQRVVLGGDVEQVLDCLGVCGVLVALHVQNNEIGFGNIRYAAPGLDQTFALELIGDQNRSASQRSNEFIFSVVH